MPSLKALEKDPRAQFTRCVIMWSDHYQFCMERSEAVRVATQEFEQKQKREDRGWLSDMQDMDHCMSFKSMRWINKEEAKGEGAKSEEAK